MMTTLIALVSATVVLVLIPGPNVALIVATSVRYGLRVGVLTALGTTAGLAVQLALVVAGLTTLIEYAANSLTWIRWAGVAYLLWLGIRTWNESNTNGGSVEPTRVVFWRGLLLAVINPKTLIFNAAFIPQFVADGSASQFALVASVYLFVVMLGDVAWAIFADAASRRLGRFARWHNRIAGGALVTAGVGLAFSRR